MRTRFGALLAFAVVSLFGASAHADGEAKLLAPKAQ